MRDQGNNSNGGSRMDVDEVKKHYEKWPFPDISFDGRESLILLRHLHTILNDGTPGIKKVVDIGCGTGHGTIAVARHFPEVRFVGLDVSSASIRKANEEIEEKGLSNVVFQEGDIRDRSSLPNSIFDLVVSFGVLHHIENAREAFRNMIGMMKESGTIILWLYGRYGRMRHNLNQAFIDMIARNGSRDERERMAREFIGHLGERYAVDSGFYTPSGSGYEGLNWLMKHGQWLADQMIPAYEHGYTMAEILGMFREHGIGFDKWIGVSTKLESYTSSHLLREAFNSLTTGDRLIAIDYLIKPEYYFVSGRKEAN